jgi:hypothetical protein
MLAPRFLPWAVVAVVMSRPNALALGAAKTRRVTGGTADGGSLAAAEIAIVRGDETTLATFLRSATADEAIATLAESIFSMLRGGSEKWILAIEPCRRRGRPRPEPFPSCDQETEMLLELLRSNPTAALKRVADLLVPPPGSRQKLVFRPRTQRRGRPAPTNLHQTLRAAWVMERVGAIRNGSEKLDYAIKKLEEEGISRRSIFRYLKMCR